jgi:hypothetical protein
MAWLDVVEDSLLIHLTLLERLGGHTRGDGRVPLAQIREVRVAQDPWSELRGRREPGIQIGRSRATGTWKFKLGKDFVALRGREPAVVVELYGAEFSRLLISVYDAEATVAEIDKRLSAHPLNVRNARLEGGPEGLPYRL